MSLGEVHWQFSQLAMFPVRGFLPQTKAEWMGLVERNVYKIKCYTEWIKSKLSKNLSHNFYKAGPPNAKTTGNRKVNKKRHRESVGRNMLRKVFQVIKWISQYSFLWWISYWLLFSLTKSIYSQNFFCWKSPKLLEVGYWNSAKLPGKNINRNSTFILLPRYCYAAV